MNRTATTAMACLLAALAPGCGASRSSVAGDAGGDHADGDGTAADGVDVLDAADATDTTDAADDVPWDDACTGVPSCEGEPAQGPIGAPCLMSSDCDEYSAGTCLDQYMSEWGGEWYVYNPGGSCSFISTIEGGCRGGGDEACPEGSDCVDLGRRFGQDYIMCMDSCTPGDTSGGLLDWACGCRKGYACDLDAGVCVSGCSNDRECCETWDDENENWMRDDGETTLHAGCESWCDGNNPEERADCKATYTCVNPGNPDAAFGDPCDHDSDCPVDGECLAYVDPDTGEDWFPGGYCTRSACPYVGRGCGDAGGWCLNTGSVVRLSGMCMRPCRVGLEMDDPEYGCRTTPGEEQTCRPVYRMGWVGGAPPGGEDGFCWPGNWPGGSGAIGDRCSSDADCASPLGLGECNDWFGAMMCTIGCNQDLAEGRAICGPAGADGVATGLCGWSMCWDVCGSPGARLGEGGCEREGFACAPLGVLGATYVSEGAIRPPGVCMPACSTDEYCEENFGPSSTCDEASGVCS